MPAPELTSALPTALTALGLGSARAVPLVWLVPAFGGARLPLAPRLGLGLLLAVLGWPHLLPAASTPALARLGALGWSLLLAREALIGASAGLVVAFAFRAAEAAGGLADVTRGAGGSPGDGGAGWYGDGDRGGGASASPLAMLYLMSSIVIFLEMGGLGRVADALARSYQAIPLATGPAPGSAAASTVARDMAPAIEVVVIASTRLIESAIGLAAPVIVALLLADLAVASVARLIPAVPIYFVSMPLRALLGVGVVLLGLGAVDAALTSSFAGWLALAERAFSAWHR